MICVREKVVRRDRPPSARRIKFAICQRFVTPGSADRIDNSPGRLYLVAANEERCITSHDVQKEPLISLWGVSAEFRIVAKIHPDRPHLDAGPGNFPIESKVNAF